MGLGGPWSSREVGVWASGFLPALLPTRAGPWPACLLRVHLVGLSAFLTLSHVAPRLTNFLSLSGTSPNTPHPSPDSAPLSPCPPGCFGFGLGLSALPAVPPFLCVCLWVTQAPF